MGCQYEIANNIIKKKADYLFSLKRNLYDDVVEYFSDFDFEKPTLAMKHISCETESTHDEAHGRIEDRDYAVSADVAWIHERHPKWKSIHSIGFVDVKREEKGMEARASIFCFQYGSFPERVCESGSFSLGNRK